MLTRLNATGVFRTHMLKATVTQANRDFGAKKKKKAAADQPSENETVDESVQTEPVQAAQPVVDAAKPWLNVTEKLDLDQSLFQPFNLGDVKEVQSTPDNKAPSYEDTIEGRYANVLFTTASQ